MKKIKNGEIISRTDEGNIWKIANYINDKLNGEYKIFIGGQKELSEHKIYSKGKLIKTIL